MAKKSDYFGLTYLVSLILAIIPVTSAICGIITRFMEGSMVGGIVRLIILLTGFGGLALWIVDLVLMILSKRILRVFK